MNYQNIYIIVLRKKLTEMSINDLAKLLGVTKEEAEAMLMKQDTISLNLSEKSGKKDLE